MIELLDNPKNYPLIDPNYDPNSEVNSTEMLILAVRNCLGFSVDKLFQGDTHSARNALAVVAYLLIHASEIELQLQVPASITKENAAKILTIDYANPKNQTDLWDMLSFPADSVPTEGTAQHAGSAAIEKFIGGNESKYPLLANWLKRLVSIANSMELRTVYQGDMDITGREYQAVLDEYQKLVNSCPEELANACPSGCKDQPVSATMIEQLVPVGFTFDPSASYDEVIGSMSIAYLGIQAKLAGSLRNFNSLECDQWLTEMSAVLGAIKKVIVELAAVIDDANAQALKDLEAQRRLREEVTKPDLSIWEAIPCCLDAVLWDRLKDSLDDWWGAKKYIVLAEAAIINIPVIVASAGIAVIPAIIRFITDFIEGMIGSGWT
ncbi:MAG: hypothetical protein WBM17_11085, partial [Anaerolineales bacterium]